MEEIILRILVEELKYTNKAAIATCHDLLEIQDSEIHEALLLWIRTRKMIPIYAEGYDAVTLTRKMRYPSALLAIDMLRREPDKAKQALKGFR